MNKLPTSLFWQWFTRNNEEYLTLQTKSKKEMIYWVNELDAHLRFYSKFFEFRMEWGPGKPSILIITVNGNAKHFKKTERFIAKAPRLRGWKFIALEEPRPIDYLLEDRIEKSGIDPRELLFSFDSDAARGGCLTIYHPLCKEENEELILQLANVAVFNLLGERSYGIDISTIEVANLSEVGSATVAKLEELPACIGLSKSIMAINANGSLVVTG